MSKKSGHIAARVAAFRNQDLNEHYLAYFDCFNRQLFYEAHDVLEELWLPVRRSAAGDFYKGLIQLAGAFVHLQKNRLQPAAALFKLARANLCRYPGSRERLDTGSVVKLIDTWLAHLDDSGLKANPLQPENPPRLELLPGSVTERLQGA